MIIGDRALLTRGNLAGLIGKKIRFEGPLAAKDREFILSFPDGEFQTLSYTTAKDKGGYSGIGTGYSFQQDGGFYKCRAVVVKSDELALQQAKTLEKSLAKVDADLLKIRDQLNKRKYRSYDYANGQIRKMLAKHGSCGKLFHVLLDARYEEAMTLTWEYEPELLDRERRLLGKYVLATSLDKKIHNAEAVLELYKSRHLVEHRFRTTKSTLKVRPVFLQKDERIRALVLVIALVVYALIEYVVKQERLATSARQALFLPSLTLEH